MESDLRGLRVDEAEDAILEVIDRGLHLGHEFLRIIHGIGTGALRSMVREKLKTSPHIVGFRPGERGEGADGVTRSASDQGV